MVLWFVPLWMGERGKHDRLLTLPVHLPQKVVNNYFFLLLIQWNAGVPGDLGKVFFFSLKGLINWEHNSSFDPVRKSLSLPFMNEWHTQWRHSERGGAHANLAQWADCCCSARGAVRGYPPCSRAPQLWMCKWESDVQWSQVWGPNQYRPRLPCP